MKVKLLIAFILSVQVFAVWQWALCTSFSDQFHFSSLDLNLRLIESIHNDVGVPITEVRLYHNKPVGFVFDIFNSYLQFWNVLFLASFLSLAGVFGLAVGFYSFFTKKKNVFLWLLFGYLLLVPFVEIFGFTKLPYLLRLVLIAIPFVVWSMYGYWNLLKEKKLGIKWIIGLLFVSLWYQLALPMFKLFCS